MQDARFKRLYGTTTRADLILYMIFRGIAHVAESDAGETMKIGNRCTVSRSRNRLFAPEGPWDISRWRQPPGTG